MAWSEAKAIANAVAKALNDNRATIEPSGSWEAIARDQIPEHKVEELAGGKVTVVPMARRSFRETRGLWRYEYDIDVGVQRQIDTTEIIADSNPTNKAVILAENIDEFFKPDAQDTLTLVDAESGATSAEFIGSQMAFLTSDHLEQQGVATSILRLTFHLWR